MNISSCNVVTSFVVCVYTGHIFFAYPLILCCRKHRVKRSIKVPAISSKLADIPPDDYSWRKYGQKPIKGSPHPRYGCSALSYAGYSQVELYFPNLPSTVLI